MIQKNGLHIGTCSWKYDSWRGLVYPADGTVNYLAEYARQYRSVEVDQWFWSLFSGDRAVLPKPEVVREYAESVPDDFLFCIKVPNSITLTHHYNRQKNQPLLPNPHFLSVPLMEQFLERIEPLQNKLGPIIFQFEYLNRQKVPKPREFFERFGNFARNLPRGFLYCMETRNPNYLNGNYFDFLAAHDIQHVFLQGYYMPSIFSLYEEYGDRIGKAAVIRLLGPNRQEIEKQTGKNWSRVVAPRDNELRQLGAMLNDLLTRRIRSYIYVNNHFEGSAPRTIARIEDYLG
jgi:uncharacterized protein YecE (DUF72 family)